MRLSPEMPQRATRGTPPFQIIVLTSQYEIWLKWAPPLERNQLVIFSISGA